MKYLPLVMLLAVLAPAAGCSSIWARNYRPNLTAPALRSTDDVTVREIPWKRMQAALQEQEDLAGATDIHPDEWSTEQRLDASEKLLRALQISADPANVRLLGVSSFRTTQKIKPWDGSLAKFARKRGANYVVWSDRYLGKADTIVTRTVWSDHLVYDDYRDPSTGRRYSDVRHYTTSRDVPLVVAKDETGYTAFFLRIDDD
ncbi:MAG TPA: hypothetical protein ENJ00_04080 [Phycisphaerales bacterium]|nr:hypothetical protein [Phycisphaerales bacterium]